MKLYTTLLLLTLFAFPGCKPNEQSQKAAVQNTAEEYARALRNQEGEKLIQLTDKKFIEFIKEVDDIPIAEIEEKLVESLTNFRGVIIVSIEAGEPGDMQKVGRQLFCFIPLITVVKPDHSGKHFSQIPLFGPSAVKVTTNQLFTSTNGSDWVTPGVPDRELLEKIYPDTKGKLLFPSPLTKEEAIH